MSKFKTSKTREHLNDLIIKSLEEENVPWQMPWDGRIFQPPQNAITKKPYRGVNAFYLSALSAIKGLDDPRFCTFKQAQEKGWKIKKGSKGFHVEYWFRRVISSKSKEDEGSDAKIDETVNDEEERVYWTVKSYVVFNAKDIVGIPELIVDEDIVNNQEIRMNEFTKQLVDNMGVQLELNGRAARYSPMEDRVEMPPMEVFKSQPDYDGTLLHELAHATGHPTRLNRKLANHSQIQEYAMEELRAEIASWFMSFELGIPLDQYHIDNHKAYLQSWGSHIKDNQRALIDAIYDAEKITDYVFKIGELEKINIHDGINSEAPLVEDQIER